MIIKRMRGAALVVAAVVAILAGMLAGNRPASAHEANLVSTLLGFAEGKRFNAEIRLKGSDVDRVVGTSVHDGRTDTVDTAALSASEAVVAELFRTHAELRGANGTVCPMTVDRLVAEEDHVTALVGWDCSAVPGEIVYRSDILTAVEPTARQIVVLDRDAAAAQSVLTAHRTELSVTGPPPGPLDVLVEYTYSGIEHIFIGYDHIAFIVAVLLWGRHLWPVVKVATSFTLAHSITLSLAVLGVVDIPGEIIEPLIAASIVFVAVENMVSRDMEKRWKYAFIIGLIHGFGFASVLRDFGLPGDALAIALAAFNLGVEVGQVAIIAIFLPSLLLIERGLRFLRDPAVDLTGAADGVAAAERNALLVHIMSGGLGVLGAYWLIERTLF